MSNKPIGGLDRANPLTGAELLPVVQDESTKQTSYADIVGFDPTASQIPSSFGHNLADTPLNPRDYPWLAKFDGITDDAAAINACAAAARAGGGAIVLPRGRTALVGSTLDFSGLTVTAHGRGQIHIQATSAQFNVIKTSGNTTLVGLFVHGGWDGSTTGLSGDILSIVAASPAYPYNVHLRDCVFQYAKKRFWYWERGGYSSVWNVKCNAAGAAGWEWLGNGSSDATTTILVSGHSTASDCNHGPSVKYTDSVSVSLIGTIHESCSQGMLIFGNDNRSLTWSSIYAENIASGTLIDPGVSGGIGATLRDSYCGGATIPTASNWVDFRDGGGNSNYGMAAQPYGTAQYNANSGPVNIAVANSGVSTVLVSIGLPPGTWDADFVVQSLANSGSPVVTGMAARLSKNSSDPALANSTSNLVVPADQLNYTLPATCDARLKGRWPGLQNSTLTIQPVYLIFEATFTGAASVLTVNGQIVLQRRP